jgi:hypothetical protein
MRASSTAKPERFHDIVVGAGFEAQNRVRIGVVAGEHDDRRPHPRLAQEFYGFPPVHVGQAHVHDDEVHVIVARRLDSRRSSRGGGQVELVVEGELVDQGFAQIGVVVDDQDLAGGHGSLALRFNED